MSLTALKIKGLKPADKPFKAFDAKGLYIEVFPNGSKLWRWKYRIAGKEKRLAFGAFPEISLAKARELRDEARAKIAEGVDPSLERKKAKATAKVSSGNTFELVAREYIEKMEREGRAESTLLKARWFLSLIKPSVGYLAIADVDPQLLLAGLKKLEKKGNHETAKKCRSFASRVFRYAVATGRAKDDPAALLKGALIAPKAKHYAAILDAGKLGDLLRAIEMFDGSPITKLALQISPHVFVRPGMLRHADWEEISFDERVWRIPAGKMKARKPHSVPLSEQVISLFKELHQLTGPNGYAFPAFHTSKRPMSENTVNAAFRRLGFTKDEVTAHGLRSTASTLLNESGKWSADAIERALAHGDSDAVRGAYHRGQHWPERVSMSQWWSDYLDRLKAGGEVVAFSGVGSKAGAAE